MILRLILRNLAAHPLRSLLTGGSVALAVFLLCVLSAIVSGLSATVEQSATHRLWVQSAVSLFVNLPLAYQSKIESVEGVEYVCKWQWFGGVYRDEDSFFAQFAVDPETFASAYPEMEVTDGSYEAFQASRTGCLIGVDLADDYGWRVGDRVPILGRIFPRPDGSAWEFTVEGIYRSRTTTSLDQKTLFFHFDYLRESLEAGEADGPPGAGVYMVRMDPGASATAVMAGIDLLFENGPQRVQTTTEAEFNRQFISMLGNIPALLRSIGGAVLFSIFFAVLNTMLMAARERTRDFGILKALGFSDRRVSATLVQEALFVCGLGAALGLAGAKAIERPFQAMLGNQFPGFEIAQGSALLALAVALGIGLAAGLAPALGAARRTPVDSLRAEA